MKRLGRRAVLRGAGGIAVGLPFLGSLLDPRESAAQPPAIPKRLVVFFSSNGTIASRWRPTGGERDFTLSEILSPLAPHRSDLCVLDGVDMVTARELRGSSNLHDLGAANCLVARRPIEGPGGSGGGGHLVDGRAGGISFDQYVAGQLGESSRFSSLVFGANCNFGFPLPARISWNDGGAVTPMQDPAAAFDRIFGAGVEDPAQLADVRARRASLLDFVRDDYDRLRPRLGVDDRARLAAHLEAIREVERAVAATSTGAACTPPARPTSTRSFADVVDANLRLGVLALACDLTPVVTFQWGTAESTQRFDWLGHDRHHHLISHDGDTNATSQSQLVAINRWYAERFAALLAQMSEITEADGARLLDHSAVMWVNELGKGNNHSFDDIPYVLAGSSGGAIPTGRYLRYAGAAHGDLFVAIANALGIETHSFGSPEHCTGPLSGLLA